MLCDDDSGLPGSEDNAENEDDGHQKSYPKAPGQKHLPQLKINNVCHVCIHTFSVTIFSFWITATFDISDTCFIQTSISSSR